MCNMYELRSMEIDHLIFLTADKNRNHALQLRMRNRIVFR